MTIRRLSNTDGFQNIIEATFARVIFVSHFALHTIDDYVVYGGYRGYQALSWPMVSLSIRTIMSGMALGR